MGHKISKEKRANVRESLNRLKDDLDDILMENGIISRKGEIPYPYIDLNMRAGAFYILYSLMTADKNDNIINDDMWIALHMLIKTGVRDLLFAAKTVIRDMDQRFTV